MIVLGVVVVLFSVSNRSSIDIELWPLPYSLPLPFYVVVLAAALLGFLGGSIITWFSAGRSRRKARFASRKASGLEKDLEKLKQKIEDLEDKDKV